MSKYKFQTLCFEQPYCPKCGQYMDETLEDEEIWNVANVKKKYYNTEKEQGIIGVLVIVLIGNW